MIRSGSVSKMSQNLTSRNKFRSTLVKNQESLLKILPIFQSYLKQYPLDIPQDVIEVVKMIEPLQNDFGENLKALKMYKQQLGNAFQQNWCNFLDYLKLIIIKLNKRTQKLLSEKQNKISQLLEIIKNMELAKIQLQGKLEKINELRELESAQHLMANNELDIVNKEMRDIYKVLQSDMTQITGYLTSLQQKKEKLDENISNQMNASLNNLSSLIQNVERQQSETGQNLATMKEMIKAMTKSVKVSTGTQVEESELQANVGSIFAKGDSYVPFDIVEGMSVNLSTVNEVSNGLEKMKSKVNEIPHQKYNPKKSVDKPWVLTPTLLVFLENMSKQNEIGRVLPWPYVKQLIEDIFEQRIKYDAQISTSIVGNMLSFDEFLILYFIQKFKIRRLAEVKLLEMIISLKYYAKFWPKAEMFCCLLDVMKFEPYSDPKQASIYKFDPYAQNYFFSIYKHVKKFTLVSHEDGAVYTQINNLRMLIKVALFFTDDLSKSRILSKLEKNIRIIRTVQHCDLDFGIQLILEQYFNVKKRNLSLISKSFSKAYDKSKGFFSISEISDIFDCLNFMFKKSQDSNQRYPIQSDLYVIKLYIHSITSGKNNNQILLNNFLSSAQKFGFDCPYPFIKAPMRKKDEKQERKSLSGKKENKKENQIIQQVRKQEQKQITQLSLQNNLQYQQPTQTTTAKPSLNLNTVRVDIASKLFSQHFSILKQLNDYVNIFSESLKQQTNPDKLWKQFNQIQNILERGCYFLKLPLVNKEKV